MGRRTQLCPEWQLCEDRSGIYSLHPSAKREAWPEAASGPMFVHWIWGKGMFAFELFFQFIKRHLFGVSFLITPGAQVGACLDCGKETWPWKEVQIEWELKESPGKQVCRRWPNKPLGLLGGVHGGVSSPAHKSLPPGSSCILSKVLPAKCSKPPGTRCCTNSILMISNLQILGCVFCLSKHFHSSQFSEVSSQVVPTPGCLKSRNHESYMWLVTVGPCSSLF